MNRVACATFLCGLLTLGATGLGSPQDDACLGPWELENFQPASSTYDQRVPSATYRDQTTVVMLLSSG